jgi:hypothetical protein
MSHYLLAAIRYIIAHSGYLSEDSENPGCLAQWNMEMQVIHWG